jgi:hypothetical protein
MSDIWVVQDSNGRKLSIHEGQRAILTNSGVFRAYIDKETAIKNIDREIDQLIYRPGNILYADLSSITTNEKVSMYDVLMSHNCVSRVSRHLKKYDEYKNAELLFRLKEEKVPQIQEEVIKYLLKYRINELQKRNDND